MGFNKTLGDEVFPTVLQNFAPESEHGVDVGSSEVEEPVVEAGVKFDLHVVRDTQRKRRFSACNDVDRCGQDFVCWWRGGRSVFHFGWALEGHGARELERGLSRHPLNHVQSFLADVVGFQEDLSLAGPVSEVNKTNGSFSTVGFHETDDGDFVSDEVAALRLQFTEGVRTVSGWYPCGHGGGVEAHNMNHSLRKADIPPTECSTE